MHDVMKLSGCRIKFFYHESRNCSNYNSIIQYFTGSTTIDKRDITHKIKCIKCDQVSYKGVREKFKLSERPRAVLFLEAVKFLGDELSIKLADIDNVEQLMAADIYAHKDCMRLYLQKYEMEVSTCTICFNKCRRRGFYSSLEEDYVFDLLQRARLKNRQDIEALLVDAVDEESKTLIKPCHAHYDCLHSFLSDNPGHTSSKACLIDSVTPVIDNMIKQEHGLALSDIKEYVSEKWPNFQFHNHHIKAFILETYGDQVEFCNPYRKYESEVVFPSSVSASDMIQRLQVLDSVAYTGKELRKTLLGYDFGLKDSICDKAALHNAYHGAMLPEIFVTFMSNLLLIPKAKLMTDISNHDGTSEAEDDEGDCQSDDNIVLGSKYNKKRLKVRSLFETMFNMVNNGEKKSPLVTMVGHTIYDKFRSKELITSFNHLGWSGSYSEVMRDRRNLGAHTISETQEGDIPWPSHFNDEDFASGGFDNFDHSDKSSMISPKDSHDTAIVLYQNNVSPSKMKGKVSDLRVSLTGRKYIKELECQKIKSYPYNKNKIMPLPKEFQSKKYEYETDNSEKVANLVRAGVFQDDILLGCPTWSGMNSLYSQRSKKLINKKIGFLPFIQNPITEIETVYTCLLNFKKISSRLKQKVFPFFCDEGVYHLVIKIQLEHPELFDDIFPMLGSFHTAKTALKCAGKYIKGCGAEDAYIECSLFGPKSVETVMNGSHYYRSFNGLMMLAEAVERLRFEAFWGTVDRVQFNEIAEIFSQFQQNLCELNSDSSALWLDKILQSDKLQPFLDSLEIFYKDCGSRSEQCKFWNGFVRIIDMIKNLIKADREGDFLLHMKAIQDLCPIFMGCGSINYQRYATYYLEQLKNLQHKMPELYASFLKGDFVVKRKSGSFNAVGGDMALEQTIQRSAKSTRGIIGKTKSQEYVSEWALVSHETLSIANTFRSITRADRGGNNETTVHHQLQKSKIKNVNNSVTKLASFIRERGNPYSLKADEQDIKLKNFVTEVYAEENVARSRTMFHEDVTAAFAIYHRQVYVDKDVCLLDRITKMVLNPVDYQQVDKLDEADIKSKFSEKFQRSALRTLLIAKDKDGDVKKLLKYDVTTFSYLYDRDFVTKPEKSQIVDELKELAFSSDADFSQKPVLDANGIVVIDFMSFIRSRVLPDGKDDNEERSTFGKFIEKVFYRMVSSYNTTKSFHVVFDSYIQGSIKGPERHKRAAGGAIHLARVRENTPMPKQLDKFWKSAGNKILLQDFASSKMTELSQQNDITLLLSGQVKEDGYQNYCTNAILVNPGYHEIPELASDLDEADMRLIQHVKWHLQMYPACNAVCVESNDSDVVVLLLFYFSDFKSLGLQKMWIHYGKGKKIGYLPLHDLFDKMGHQFCRALLKCHLGTGCDYLSKIGTKKSALAANPKQNLSSFGEPVNLTEEQISEAEEYLVDVYSGVRTIKAAKKSSKLVQRSERAKSFDDLRFSEYRKKVSALLLPPTSHSIRNAHIRRWFYLYKRMSSLLQDHWDCVTYNPTMYGWKMIDAELYPEKGLNLLPDKLCKTCSCKTGCKNKRCHCVKNGSHCSQEYCQCVNCVNR